MKKMLAAIFLMSVALGGCATNSNKPTLAAGHAECTVCKCNNDMACLDVKIDASTPRAEYNGKTYYFCSEDCQKQFLKNPAQYANFKPPF